MLFYPAKIQPDGSGFLVRFRDIPEAITSGDTREEAIEMAKDALVTAMDFYFEDQKTVPLPSAKKRGETLIDLPTSVAAKVMLLNEMLRSKVRPAELARKLDTSPQVVNRLIDLHHATKIDAIAEALGVLGKRLQLQLV
jgi:antitoxin HicB